MPARVIPKVFTCIALLMISSCGGESSVPTTSTPVPTPTPAPVPTPAPAPGPRGHVEALVVPNPVPFSGARITDVSSCESSPNTWFYEFVLFETGGSTLTFTRRVDFFDSVRVNDRSDINVVVPAGQQVTLRTRWCATTSAEHSAESVFTGTDASGNLMTATAGTVRLLAKP